MSKAQQLLQNLADEDEEDEEDEDFQPEVDDEDDVNEVVNEEQSTAKGKKPRKAKEELPQRKRKKIKGLEGLEEPKPIIESPSVEINTSSSPAQDPQPSTEDKSKKIQSIWEQMKQDNQSTQKKPTPATPPTEIPAKKTITETYDFAGETIKVTKTVAANAAPPKKKGNLDSLLGNLNKKKKMSTLQKSQLDWDNFKEKEGIQDELNEHLNSKNSYLDKQAFLARTDARQFENERDVRISRRKNNM